MTRSSEDQKPNATPPGLKMAWRCSKCNKPELYMEENEYGDYNVRCAHCSDSFFMLSY